MKTNKLKLKLKSFINLIFVIHYDFQLFDLQFQVFGRHDTRTFAKLDSSVALFPKKQRLSSGFHAFLMSF